MKKVNSFLFGILRYGMSMLRIILFATTIVFGVMTIFSFMIASKDWPIGEGNFLLFLGCFFVSAIISFILGKLIPEKFFEF